MKTVTLYGGGNNIIIVNETDVQKYVDKGFALKKKAVEKVAPAPTAPASAPTESPAPAEQEETSKRKAKK